MSLIEKVLIFSAILMPFVALVIFLPKIVKAKLAKKPKQEKPKKEKAKKKKSKPTTPYIPEPTPIESKPEIVQPTRNRISTTGYADDFKDYALRKSKRTPSPMRNFPTPDFSGFDSFYPRTVQPTQDEKPLADEIKSLSPQLKALIISGALDRKDFDD